jgi:multiple sugar transport system substrate-binding protein
LYNRDLFVAAGTPTPAELIATGEWTWENLAVAAKAITDMTDAYGFQSTDGALYTGNFWATLIPIVRGFGGDAWTADNACTFNSAETVAGLQFIHNLIFTEQSMVPPGTEVDFYAGSAGMTLGQLSRVNRLTNAEFAWSIAPLPAGPAGYQSVIGQAAMVVFNNGRNRETAIDFVRFLTSEPNVARLAQFFPPARASVLNSEALVTANPLVPAELMQTAVIDAIQQGQVLPSSAQFPRVELLVRPLLDDLWTADADVQAVTNSICEQINPLLAR